MIMYKKNKLLAIKLIIKSPSWLYVGKESIKKSNMLVILIDIENIK